MKILGIETSCDETAAAVVENGTKILSNIVATSSEMHAKTGGIIPEQAARQQLKSIIPVVSEAISEAFKIKSPTTNYQLLTTKIDAIAITVGPGLIGSLLVGVEVAKTLSYLWKKPIIPVNHLAAHVYANWLENSEQRTVSSEQKNKTEHPPTSHTRKRFGRGHTPHTLHQPQFPALALVVSGGHTDLVLMKGHPSANSGQANIKWIGGTRDDAAGEAFDKTARLLGLRYPGGPAIAAKAAKFEARNPKFELKMLPRPMMGEENYDWSFSGLKTAVLRKVKEQESKRVKEKLSTSRLAAEIQEAIVDVLVEKTLRAIKKYKPKSLFLAGGVAANKKLTEKFIRRIKDEKLQVYFHVPPVNLCTDNATYIAGYGYYNIRPVDWKKIKANPQLTIVGEI